MSFNLSDENGNIKFVNNTNFDITLVEGGVCAPHGFKASGIHCGIRASRTKRDFALIVSDVDCSAAGAFTKNVVKGAPVVLSQKNVSDGHARAIICNSGNANTCAPNGMEIARGMCRLAADKLGISEDDVLVASTGVIGQPMSMEPMEKGMDELVSNLFDDAMASKYAAEAIMTTDTRLKEIAIEFELGGKNCRIGAIAKGSGMINPNMATMLCFITTDVNIAPEILQRILSNDILDSFNMVCVDGDTSTNDTVLVLANGLAKNDRITDEKSYDFEVFSEALRSVTTYISKNLAADGEGATKLIECNIRGSISIENARKAASSVIASSLVKAAMFGADANWGRILCALGYGGAYIDVNKVSVDFASAKGVINVCKNGGAVDFSEEKAKEILLENYIAINVSIGNGKYGATAWGCDLTYDYVKINGDYRS